MSTVVGEFFASDLHAQWLRAERSCILNVYTLRAWLVQDIVKLQSQLFYLLALWVWTTFFISLRLCVPISKMGLMIPTQGLNGTIHVKYLSRYLAYSKCAKFIINKYCLL